MLWKKTIEQKDLLCPCEGKWLVEVTVPVIQAIPPPCFKDKEWFYCCNARRIAGTPKWQVTTECWYIFWKEKYEIFRREWEQGDDGWLGYFLWHVSPLSRYHCELPIAKSDTEGGFLHAHLFTLCSTSFGIWIWIRMCLRIWVLSFNFSSPGSSKKW